MTLERRALRILCRWSAAMREIAERGRDEARDNEARWRRLSVICADQCVRWRALGRERDAWLREGLTLYYAEEADKHARRAAQWAEVLA